MQDKNIFITGGFVRDSLLGKQPSDIDYVAVGYSPEDFSTDQYKMVGKDFPVFLDKSTGSEIALARTESSTGQSTIDFKINTEKVTLEEDLKRRDLTINSMAIDPNTNEIIDPFGGQQHIQDKLLKHTSDAFFEDPVRVLRLARFRAMLPDWKIDYDLKAMIYKNIHSLSSLQPDRIWKEVEKALKLPHFHVFFETLFELGVLDVIFPEIYQLTTLKEGSKWHREASVFEHTMMMFRELSKIKDQSIVSSELKLAILFHDIAKPFTYRKYGSSAGHEQMELVEPRISAALPRMPKNIKNSILFLISNHINIYKMHNMRKKTLVDFLAKYIKYKDLIDDQCALAILDKTGRIQDEEATVRLLIESHDFKKYVEKIEKINAKEFMKRKPDANPQQVKQYLYDLRAKEVSQLYQYLQLNKPKG